MTDYEHMLVSALRYALGRRTYIVGVTTRYIEQEIPKLSRHCKSAMIRDILNPLIGGYGNSCDRRDWMRLLGKLKESSNE